MTTVRTADGVIERRSRISNDGRTTAPSPWNPMSHLLLAENRGVLRHNSRLLIVGKRMTLAAAPGNDRFFHLERGVFELAEGDRHLVLEAEFQDRVGYNHGIDHRRTCGCGSMPVAS